MKDTLIEFDCEFDGTASDRDAIAVIVSSLGTAAICPGARRIVVRVGPEYNPTCTPIEAHRTWLPAAIERLPRLPNLPSRPLEISFDVPVRLLEISLIARSGGGVDSYYGFVGYFISCVVDLGRGAVLDVRGEPAS